MQSEKLSDRMEEVMKSMGKRVMSVLLVTAMLVGVLVVPVQKAEAASKEIFPESAIIMKGDSFRCRFYYGFYALDDEDDEISKDDIKWQSSNSKVAKLGRSAMDYEESFSYMYVKAKKVGKATITVMFYGKTYQIKVTVLPARTSKDNIMKTKKGNVNPIKQYKKYDICFAWYTKQEKSFKSTNRGIKLNQSLNDIYKKYGNLYEISTNIDFHNGLRKLQKADKKIIKLIGVSGVKKVYVTGNLRFYLSKTQKIKAIVIEKNYEKWQDYVNGSIESPVPKLTKKGNVAYGNF